MRLSRGAPRTSIAVRIRTDLVEALEETADELVVSRNLLVERAVEEYLRRLELPIRVVDTGRRVAHPPTCGSCHGAGCPIVEAPDLRKALS